MYLPSILNIYSTSTSAGKKHRGSFIVSSLILCPSTLVRTPYSCQRPSPFPILSKLRVTPKKNSLTKKKKSHLSHRSTRSATFPRIFAIFQIAKSHRASQPNQPHLQPHRRNGPSFPHASVSVISERRNYARILKVSGSWCLNGLIPGAGIFISSHHAPRDDVRAQPRVVHARCRALPRNSSGFGGENDHHIFCQYLPTLCLICVSSEAE